MQIEINEIDFNSMKIDLEFHLQVRENTLTIFYCSRWTNIREHLDKPFTFFALKVLKLWNNSIVVDEQRQSRKWREHLDK